MQVDVDRLADKLLQAGERPSIEKVRAKLGGSPNTIARYLDAWWRRLSARVQIGPSAFDRLPKAVAHLAESFFLSALEEARALAQIEESRAREASDAAATETMVREHVLALREGELQERLNNAEARQKTLERELRELRLAHRKFMATHQLLLDRSRLKPHASTKASASKGKKSLRKHRKRPARKAR